jgi:hypothetical protein
MDGSMAQLIALTAHGNGYLSGKAGVVPPDLSLNSTFHYVGDVRFSVYENREAATGAEIAANTADWFRSLRQRRVSRLWNLAFRWDDETMPERRAGAFANESKRAIQVDLPDGFECWYPHWEAGGDSAKPWRVVFRCLRFPHSQMASLPHVRAIKKEFERALTLAHQFSLNAGGGAEAFTTLFSQSRQLLKSRSPLPLYHPDMLPNRGYGRDARQLLSAASCADVFGGMGSWNDISYGDAKTQTAYDQVSDRLHAAIKSAYFAGSNAFDPLVSR